MRPPADADLRQPRILHECMPQWAHLKGEQNGHSGAGYHSILRKRPQSIAVPTVAPTADLRWPWAFVLMRRIHVSVMVAA